MTLKLSHIAQAYLGGQKGRDDERRRQRVRTIEGREDELYEHQAKRLRRATELGELEHGDKVRGIQEERGAREAVLLQQGEHSAAEQPSGRTTVPDDGSPATPSTMPDDGTKRMPRPLGGEPGSDGMQAVPRPARRLSGAGGSAEGPSPAQNKSALWLRQAEAQRDYWTKRGRPERASKAMVDAYRNSFAEDEARFKFETQPQEEALRRRNLTVDEMEKDQKARELRQSAIQAQLSAAGKLWGLMKIGATAEALELFNTSSMLQPGVQATSAKVMKAKDQNGQIVDVMVLLDQKGEVIKDKNGKELIYPVSMLERAHRLATTSTVHLKKGESVYQLQTELGGATTATQVLTAPDPDERARGERDRLGADKAWSEALNRQRDDAARYLKDTLGLSANVLGQIMKPENQPIFERALPKVNAKLQQARRQGQKLDELDGLAIAKEALDEARDELKREATGAGQRGERNPRPTVRDIIGG